MLDLRRARVLSRTPIPLTPVADVGTSDGLLTALSREPWLRIEYPTTELGGWIELRYQTSFLDAVARPVLRCFGSDGAQDMILPAPILGTGIWRGVIPANVRDIWVSPTDHRGPFAFSVTALRPLGLRNRMIAGLRARARLAMLALLAEMSGRADLAQRRFRRVLGANDMSAYARWRKERRRAPDWAGLDAPRTPPAEGPHVRIVLRGGLAPDTDRWRRDLERQGWTNSSLIHDAGLSASAHLTDLGAHDLAGFFEADDCLSEEAIAVVAAVALRNQNACLFYFDEQRDGPKPFPVLKPDWSPTLFQSVDFVGRAWFARVGWLRERLGEARVDDILARPSPLASGDRTAHIARLLIATRKPRVRAPSRLIEPATPLVRGCPCATLIVPTRDRLDLLAECIASAKRANPSNFEAIVVDNGSVQPETLHYLQNLESDSRFRVIYRPGPFNYAALCNDAARLATSDILVFLNNDVEATEGDWLGRMIAWAEQPGVGAVGAKLLYPNQTVQHAGVALGVGGRAAHIEKSASADDLGYFGRLCAPHEVSAVTGACLAVARSKFDSVGGFDAENLPVDLNDIDLCLRLAEQGLTNLLEPRARLIHRESASRGQAIPASERYGKEIAYFKTRWRHLLRADPYYHPALSLESFDPALG